MKFPSRHRVRANRVLRGLLCALVLLGQLATVVGFPIFASSSASRTSCAGAACGCSEELKASKACCCYSSSVRHEPATRSCCQKPAKSSCDEKFGGQTADRAEPEAKTFRWVAGVEAQRCSGEGPLAMQSGEPMFFGGDPAQPRFFHEQGDRLVVVSDSPPPLPLDPPIPPPRLG